MNENQRSMLLVIAPRKEKERLISALHELEVVYINVMYGKGSLSQSSLANVLGFESEPHKIVITAFVRNHLLNDVFTMLEEKFKFGQPNTGFAFSIPVEKIGG